jgi:hypothetical protein
VPVEKKLRLLLNVQGTENTEIRHGLIQSIIYELKMLCFLISSGLRIPIILSTWDEAKIGRIVV